MFGVQGEVASGKPIRGPTMQLAAPEAGRAVPFLDLIPAYEKAGKYRVLRNRTGNEAGLTVGGKPMRGLNCPAPSRIGFLLEGVFERMEIEVGVLQRGGGRGVTVRVLGDGRVLASTPPLFVGQQPVRLEFALRNVVLLEFVAEGPRGSRVVWGNGSLWGGKDRDLSLVRVAQERFSPGPAGAAEGGRLLGPARQRTQGSQP